LPEIPPDIGRYSFSVFVAGINIPAAAAKAELDGRISQIGTQGEPGHVDLLEQLQLTEYRPAEDLV
jgi:hypothetical protein